MQLPYGQVKELGKCLRFACILPHLAKAREFWCVEMLQNDIFAQQQQD